MQQKESFRHPLNLRSWGTPLALLFLFFLWIGVFNPVLFGQKNLREDAIQLEYPGRVFARTAILNGEFPHWVPYQFSGMPFFATQLGGVLYPMNLLMSVVPVDARAFWYLIELMALLHILAAGVGMFFYIWKGKGLSRQAALFAGISYMLCGFLVCHLVHPMMLNIVAWIPLILFCFDRGIASGKIAWFLWAGLILGLSALAGHPQVTIYEFVFLGAYAAYSWFAGRNRSLSTLVRIAASFGIAVAIGSIQMLPALEINQYSARSTWTFDQASEGSMSIGHFLTLLMPKFFGAWTGQPIHEVPQFWLNDSYHCGYYTYWETAFYTGIPVLLLALAGLRRLKTDPFVPFVLGWGVVSLLYAMGSHTPIYKVIFDYVPVLGSFRSPSRILFTWNVLAPVLAAHVFDEIRTNSVDKNGGRLLYALGAAAVVLGFLAFSGLLAGAWPESAAGKNASYAAAQGGIVTLLGGAFIALLYYSRRPGQRTGASILFIFLLAADMAVFGFGHHLTDETAVEYFDRGRNIVRQLKEESKTETFRSNMRQFILHPDSPIVRQNAVMPMHKSQGLVDGIELLEGYSPLNLRFRLPPLTGRNFDRLLDLLNVKYYMNPKYGTTSKVPFMVNEDRLPRAKLFYKTRVLTDSAQAVSYLNSPEFDHHNELILNETPPFIPESGGAGNGTARITRYSLNAIDLSVATDAGGYLWLSEIWYPLWKATVDGKPAAIVRADCSFRAIPVTKGTHTVSLRYRSPLFAVGAALAIGALMLSIGGLTACWLFDKKKRATVCRSVDAPVGGGPK